MKFIFEIRIKEGHTAEEYADAWVRASELIQQAPGARGTRLHRSLDDPKRLIAIAEWDSKAQRDAMEKKDNPEIANIIRSAAPFVEIKPIGEFDDPEWVVLPETMADSTDTRTNKDGESSHENRKFSVSANRDKASHKLRYVETGGAGLDTEECTFCQSVPELSDRNEKTDKTP